MFVAETEFSRNMMEITAGAEKVRTIRFPNTVRRASNYSFADNKSLRSAVLNEDLEELGERNAYCSGVFSNTCLRQVNLPTTLRALGDYTFYGCNKLRSVAFREGSRLEKIGSKCFSCSGLRKFQAPPGLKEIGQDIFSHCKNLKQIVLNEGLEKLVVLTGKYEFLRPYDGIFGRSSLEEIVLPSTLKEISGPVFRDCDKLRIAWVEEGCTADFQKSVEDYVTVLPEKLREEI